MSIPWSSAALLSGHTFIGRSKNIGPRMHANKNDWLMMSPVGYQVQQGGFVGDFQVDFQP